jgi:hypothetical protein
LLTTGAPTIWRKKYDLLGPRQAAQVAMNDNAVEAVINEDKKIAEQLEEEFHGRPQKTHPAGTGPAMVDGKDFRLADEVRHIQKCAARHNGRIVTLGQLIFFSTETGDAWLLDWEDGLASPLARDGDPEPIHIEETDTNFTVDWKGNYRIEGAAFIFVDRKTHGTRAILGYPTQKLDQLARGR